VARKRPARGRRLGERCNTYDDPVFKGRAEHRIADGVGSHGLCAFDDPENPALKRGIEYLCRTQNADGSWTEAETTGTGFPKVFYLKYDMYRNAWPLLALATYRQVLQAKMRNGQSKHLPEELAKPAAES